MRLLKKKSDNGFVSELFQVPLSGGFSKIQKITFQKIPQIEAFFPGISPGIAEAFSVLTKNHLLWELKGISDILFASYSDKWGLPFSASEKSSLFADPMITTSALLRKDLKCGKFSLKNERNIHSDPIKDKILREIITDGCGTILNISEEGLPHSVLLHPFVGRIRERSPGQEIICNSHFFLMDYTDQITSYDLMGEPYGLLLADGKVLLPPLYPRTALLWEDDGRRELRPLAVEECEITVGSEKVWPIEKHILYRRPEWGETPSHSGKDIVIVGTRVVAINRGGKTAVPMAGFVISVPQKSDLAAASVNYTLPSRWKWGVQTGPYLLKNGERANGYDFPFYQGAGIPYPPTQYPLDWTKDQAARMGIGFIGDKFSLLWGEGCKPQFRKDDSDSTGFSNEEFLQVAIETGFTDFINLDGGGSAQIAINGASDLLASDRWGGNEFERPVPAGIRFIV